MKKFFEEFKTFITKGNVMDMAIGVIVGGAFGAITSSLVSNVITPLLAFLFGAPNTDALNITLRAAELDASGEVVKEALVLGLGTFVGAILNFLIIALVLFSVVKAINKARALAEARKKAEEEAAAAAAEPEEPKPTAEDLLGAILEELKAKK
ncbi:MAG: large conductance mechanosensitive channel protein MscL [Oscillospiraceae bacterium]|nr:large conductance mechanosensitive channel protein MscL [Oscillospiraceae bacterium]